MTNHDVRPGPRGVPELRLMLADEWLPGRPFAESRVGEREAAREIRAGRLVKHPAGLHERGALLEAELWWVGDEMADLLDAAAPSIPGVALTLEVMPSLSGLVRFAHGLRSLDAEWEELPLTVDAMCWGPINLPPRRGSSQLTPGVGISNYRLITPETLTTDLDAAPDSPMLRTAAELGIDRPMWVPLGRADWCLGDEPDVVAFDPELLPADDPTHLSMVEDRRRLLALWTLSRQPGVASRRTDPGDRHERRRAARARLPAPDVTVINLRRPPSTGPAGESGVAWSHRWIVGGHWREQPYGPARSLRRPVWIAPYTKGPADKPLLEPTKVRSWTR